MAAPEKDKDNQALVNDLTRGFEDLKVSFDLYFSGLERKPPLDKRTELVGKLRKAKEQNTRNTGLKFRINQLWASYQTHDTKWNRILKEIEEGTYKRDRFKVKLREREENQDATEETDLKSEEIFEVEDLDFDVEENDDGQIPAVAVVKAPGKPAPAPVFGAPAARPGQAATSLPPQGAPRPTNPFATAQAPGARVAGTVPPAAGAPRPVPPGTPGSPFSRPPAAGANPAAPGAPRPVAPGANPAAPGAPRPGSSAALPTVQPRAAMGANPAAPGAPRSVSNPSMAAVTPRAAMGANPAAPGAPRAVSNGSMAAIPPRPASSTGSMARPVPPGTPGATSMARPAVPPAAAPRPAAPSPPGITDDAVRRIHTELSEAKRRAGDRSPDASFDSLKAQLNKSVPAIKQQHGAREVDFRVEVKDGKAVLKAIPRK